MMNVVFTLHFKRVTFKIMLPRVVVSWHVKLE